MGIDERMRAKIGRDKRDAAGGCGSPDNRHFLSGSVVSAAVFMSEIARILVYGEVWRAGVARGGRSSVPPLVKGPLRRHSFQDVGDLLRGAAVVGWETQQQRVVKEESANEHDGGAYAPSEGAPPLKRPRRLSSADDADAKWRREGGGNHLSLADQLGECRQEILLPPRRRRRRPERSARPMHASSEDGSTPESRQTGEGRFDDGQSVWKDVAEVTVRLSGRTALRRIQVTWQPRAESNAADERDENLALSSSSGFSGKAETHPESSPREDTAPLDIRVEGWDAAEDEKVLVPVET